MREYKISEGEAGQTLNKFMHKYMPKAPSSFFYKMYRKKNIVLNRKKVGGKEMLMVGDVISFFLAEETILNFQNQSASKEKEYEHAYQTWKSMEIIYEDQSIVVVNKPSGVLTQKAGPEDESLNEWLIGYLLHSGAVTSESLKLFHPSVLNRLDRNTYGLVIGSKSLLGAQTVSKWIRERSVRKFYRLIVKGTGLKETTIKGYLYKDPVKNRVSVRKEFPSHVTDKEVSEIETRYYPIREYRDKSLVEVELITGKTHQIRAHMASIGHPLLGDYKYGDSTWNDFYRKQYGIQSQLLAACRLEFPETQEVLSELNGRVISIPLPDVFTQILKEKNEG